MKLRAKILIVPAAMIVALSAYFWLKPVVTVEKIEGTASLSRSVTNPEEIPVEEAPAEEAPSPELGGFFGLETELDALLGAM